MKIIDIWPMREGSSTLARFDLELTEQVRIFGLHLKRSDDGRMRVFGPKSGGRHAASFHPTISEEITSAAIAALEGKSHVEHRE
jgi:hypothetical protein